MNTTTLVTVVIPSYNHRPYIEQAILSVLNQTYANIELIVIDDGSTDNSVDLIRALSVKHRFRFIEKGHEGLTKTLNIALCMARGEYFVPLSSDDMMLLDRIEKQVQFMQKYPALAVSAGNMIRIEPDGRPRRIQKFYPERVLTFDDIFENRVKGPPAPTLMYVTDELRGIGGYREDILLEDFYTILAITAKGKKIGVMHDILAFYRSHPSNTYKNYSYMADNILKTYALFADRPNYDKAVSRYLNGMIKRVSRSDKRLAIKLLKKVPLRFYNRKTVSGIFRIIFG